MSDLPDYEERSTDPMTDAELHEKLAELAGLKAKYRALKDEAKAAEDHHNYQQALMFERLRDRNMLSIKTDFATYVCKSTVYGNVNDIEAFRAWCETQDLVLDFVKDAPQKQRVNELVRNALDSGEELPPGVNWYSKDYISISEN